ncbi:MAG TPA: ABC transporter permease subunit [Dehalococcoidia bacterium]|nr:ABC transporter permease subunit [Dehalococcoidia bacterium]
MFKLRKRSLTWILLAILLSLILVLYLLLWTVTETVTDQVEQTQGLFGTQTTVTEVTETLYLEQAIPFGLQITQLVGTFLGILLASASMGNEYGWGTIRSFLVSSPARWQFLTGKIVAVSVMVFLGTLAAMVTAVVASTVISGVAGDLDYGFVDWQWLGDAALAYGRTVLAIAPYIAIAFFFAAYGRSTLAGIGAAVGILFLENLITSLMRLAGDLPSRLTNVLPGANVETLMLQNELGLALNFQERSQTERIPLDPPFAALVLVAYIVALIAATYILFQKRDVE